MLRVPSSSAGPVGEHELPPPRVHAAGKSQGPGESTPPGEVTPKTAGGDGASLTSSALGRGSGRGRRQATFTAADPAARVHERLRGN